MNAYQLAGTFGAINLLIGTAAASPLHLAIGASVSAVLWLQRNQD